MGYFKHFAILLLLLLLSVHTISAQPTVSGHFVLQNNGKYNKLEIGMDVNTAGIVFNPYDYMDLDIFIEFKHRLTGSVYDVYAFYYQDYSYKSPLPQPGTIYTPVPFLDKAPTTPHPWRVRFAPPKAGMYDYTIFVYYKGYPVQNIRSDNPITVADNSNKGYIERFPGRHFAGSYRYNDGTPYFPIGMNLAELYQFSWYDYNHWSNQYLKAIDSLAAVGGNFIRLDAAGDEFNCPQVLPSGDIQQHGLTFGLQWGNPAMVGSSGMVPATKDYTPIGNYDNRQDRAWLLDQFIDHANEKGVAVQLGLFGWQELNNWSSMCTLTTPSGPVPLTLWDLNPYKQLGIPNGDFFTDANALHYQRCQFRYMAARYGYATNLFAWEMVGEVDLLWWGHASGIPNPSNGTPGPTAVKNWVTTMHNWLKDAAPNIMTTFSMGHSAHWTVSDPVIQLYQENCVVDILQDHVYDNTQYYNAEQHYRKNLIDRVDNPNIDKPYLMGEFGPSIGGLCPVEHNHDPAYYLSNYHQGLWGTSFSGASGAGVQWDGSQILPLGTGSRCYLNIKPLRVLMDQIDFKNHNYLPIVSNCGPATPSLLNMSTTTFDYFDTHLTTANPPTATPRPDERFSGCPSYMSYDYIHVYDNAKNDAGDRLLVLGLKDDDDIYGWMKKKDNFWWKLPHRGSPDLDPHYDENCKYTGGYFPASSAYGTPGTPGDAADAATCQNYPLENTRAVFDDVCNGEYQIEYYSTYPSYPTTMFGTPHDGGVIPSFTRRLLTTNNKLDVKVPPLKPMVQPAGPQEGTFYAPDYGYHIRRMKSENFVHSNLGQQLSWEAVDPTTKIASFYRLGYGVQKVFMKGVGDQGVHQYWYDYNNATWNHATMLPVPTPPSQAVDGAISTENYTEDNVFFRCVDHKVHGYHFIPGTPAGVWVHVALSSSGSSTEDMDAYSDLDATNQLVAYKGTDSKLHLYTNTGSTTWAHSIMPTTSSAQYVDGDIEFLDDFTNGAPAVFYVTPNGSISVYYKTPYVTAPWAFANVSPTSPVLNESALNSTIRPLYVNGEVYCFYIGYDGYVQYYKSNSMTAPYTSGWVHGYLGDQTSSQQTNTFSNLESYNNDLYYCGIDNRIHRFYFDNVEWRHSAILPCSTSAGGYLNSFKLTYDRTIAYVGPPNPYNIIEKYRDDSTCQKCTNFSYPVFKTAGSTREEYNNPGNVNVVDMGSSLYTIKIYPNPASDEINIEFDNTSTKDISVRMLNTVGVEVRKIMLQGGNNRYKLQTGELPRGLYYIYLLDKSGKNILSKKITLN